MKLQSNVCKYLNSNFQKKSSMHSRPEMRNCVTFLSFLIIQRISSAGDDHTAINNGTGSDMTINETIEIDKENKSLLQVQYML